jgi:hypothetical protein
MCCPDADQLRSNLVVGLINRVVAGYDQIGQATYAAPREPRRCML